MQKFALIFPFLFLFLTAGPAGAAWGAPYEGYNYSNFGQTQPAPVPYAPIRQINGEQLGIGPLNSPEDVFISDDGYVYIADTGNDRIVCLDPDFNAVRIIDKFANAGLTDTFRKPQGIFVDRHHHLFIADTANQRIVELTPEGQLARVIEAPKSELFRENFVYTPIKLVVDTAGRLYVVSKGTFDGILELDANGSFSRFIGTNKVQFNAVDLFWKRISTERQRKQMQLNIPVEFNNVAIDKDSFIYATTSEEMSNEPVKRLNPSGVDVLRREGYFSPKGDIQWSLNGTRKGASALASVTIDRNGMYSILDQRKGRIFTYDRDGKLLYLFGHIGEQFGNFKMPVAIGMKGDHVIVLDKGLNQLTVFKPTRYGKTIRDAVIFSDLGEKDKASAAWLEAQKLNTNLEIAYLGVGKAELRKGSNLEAMANFKLGMHKGYYSRAFERFRKEFLWDHFNAVALTVVAAAVLSIAAARRVRPGEPGVLRMAWYTMFHPFNGFWELKYEKKGKLWFALLILLSLSVLYIVKRQYSGFIFNMRITDEVNSLDEIKFILLPFLLWCIANWSLTTLMDGEGKFKEIVISTGYALLPLMLAQVPLITLSNVLTANEASFYYLVESIAYCWVAWLLFAAMQTVHQYQVSKTILTMLLTLVVIGIFIFLALLFFALLQQMLVFGTTVYREIMFRIGEG
ncbi:YIP1 family protein [Paenibacillus sp. GCM10027626]|uniref:YIP1 family protein n=1 Tax=Paenibacillus sp. GCM10027626 TaxID=3273411 RepID=UPI00362CFAC8